MNSVENIHSNIPAMHKAELFTTLLQNKNVRIERIVSSGQITPPDKPYNQIQDEWVIVLQGHATLDVAGKKVSLHPGDYYLIPAHTRHLVTYTSKEPQVIWLAVHIFPEDPGGRNQPERPR